MDNNVHLLDQSSPPVSGSTASIPVANPDDQKKGRGIKTIIAIVILLLVTGVGAVVYEQFYQQSVKENISQSNNGSNGAVSQPSPTVTKKANIVKGENVDWLSAPKKISSVGFFKLIDQHYPFRLRYAKDHHENSFGIITTDYESKATYYEVGTVNNGQYKGGTVILGVVRGLPNSHVIKGIPTKKDVVNDRSLAYLFIKMPDSTFVVTNDYDNKELFYEVHQAGYGQGKGFVAGIDQATGIRIDDELSLDKVVSAHQYLGYSEPTTGIKFSITRTSRFFHDSGQYLVKDLGNNTMLYSNQNNQSNPIRLKTVINPTFVIKLPTGLAADARYANNYLIYQKPTGSSDYPFSPSNDRVASWIAQDKPKQLPKAPTKKGIIMSNYTGITYTYDYDGCRGNITFENATSDTEYLDKENNLIQVGTTDKGDTLYEMKNKDFKIFDQLWFWKVFANGLNSLTYPGYLDLKPILVKKDKLGIYHTLFRTELVASQCWGEPLIYLYPEKPTQVQVKLSKAISLTESEPPYSDGWQVMAYPDGKIYDLAKKKYYPYLYWEGSAPTSWRPVFRDVVAKTDVHQYLDVKLSQLGLNDKEKADFEHYWEPQLQDSSYYLISFYDGQELDKIAPLNVVPKPDTVIRVLMAYEGFNKKPNIEGQAVSSYKTPLRKGFTLVEWGGILHKYN